MTNEDLAKLTPDEKRCRIGEIMGYKIEPFGDGAWRVLDPRGQEIFLTRLGRWRCAEGMPNVLGDLNACHEMERLLTDEKWRKYIMAMELWIQSNRAELQDVAFLTKILIAHAAPAQKVDAFLIAAG